jgi:mRNA m6A methyltransferase catalytic subunit
MSNPTFRVIVADPPWSFKDSLKMSDVARGAAANYKVMTISDIKQLPIKDYADPSGAILALWVPSSLLQEGLDTMKAWGFKHKQTYIWVKTKKEPLKGLVKSTRKLFSDLKSLAKAMVRVGADTADLKKEFNSTIKQFEMNSLLAFGMGRLFRQTHEICLVGTNNNKIYKQLKNKSQRSVSFGENLKHSAKPEHLQDSLEIMFPKGRKLELFARRHRAGWECLGNEICNGEDITVSLAKLV